MRKVLIYGGTSAIAEAYAKLSLEKGDRLCLVGRDEQSLLSTAQDLRVQFDLSSSEVGILTTDFQDDGLLVESFKRAVEMMGGIDHLFIAHGSLPDQEVLAKDFSQVRFHHQVNYLSPVVICEAAAQYFLEQEVKGAQISVISSVAGDRGRKSNYFYGASKGALSIYLQGLRTRLHSSGIGVLTIKPGFVDTPMTAHMEKGLLWVQPETIAKGILKAEEGERNVCYLPFFWCGIMTIIKMIPEVIFKRLSI